MVCISDSCPRYKECARAKGSGLAEALASLGYGVITTEDVVNYYVCGPLGNYKMFIEDKGIKDVVKIVRCGSCKHRPQDPKGVGYGFSLEWPDEVCPFNCDDGFYSRRPESDFYCAYGEEEEESNDV